MIITPESDLLNPYRIYEVTIHSHIDNKKSTLYICGGLINEYKIVDDKLKESEISNGTASGSGIFLIKAIELEFLYRKIINNHFVCAKIDINNNQCDLDPILY